VCCKWKQVGGGHDWLRGDAQGRTHDRGNATEASLPSPSDNPGPASCRGTMHELTATRVVNLRPMGALGRGQIKKLGVYWRSPPLSPLLDLNMQSMLIVCVLKLNSTRQLPESAISGSALSHFPSAQLPLAGMAPLENHRRSRSRSGALGVSSGDMPAGSCRGWGAVGRPKFPVLPCTPSAPLHLTAPH